MPNRNYVAVLCLLLLPVALFAQSGKISGKVTDLETREPLIGATVKIVGTTMGASTDINGNFVILNVPVGSQTLECNYIGYKKVTIRDVRVISSQTTERNFQLPSDAYKLETAVDIVAERPLVNKNETNSQSNRSQEEIENLPVRGVEGIVALMANVVNVGGIHIGGSRSDQVEYRVDGVRVNDPVYGGRVGAVINNAIEEISMQAGGYSAEYGGATGGIIQTTTRSGGRTLQFSGELISDSWAKPGKEAFLGTRSFGTNQYILTAGGPLVGPVRFFIAGQNSFQRTPVSNFTGNDLTRYYAPLRQTAAWANLYNENKYVTDPNGQPLYADAAHQVPLLDKNGNQLRGPMGSDGLPVPVQGIFDPQLGKNAYVLPWSYPAYTIGYAATSWATQGSLTADLNQINIRLTGSYNYNTSTGGVGLTALNDIRRQGVNQNETFNGGVRFTHMLSEKTFYELNLSYFRSFGMNFDPDLKSNVWQYGDSLANAQYGYTLLGDGIPPLTKTVYGNSFVDFGYPLASYNKSKYESISGRIGFTHQIGKVHEIKFGGELESYTIRLYDPNREFSIKNFIRNNPQYDALDLMKNTAMNNYGYDIWGNALDSGPDGPKKPVFGAVYALDKIELEDLILNVGLRYDLIDTDSRVFKNPNNIVYNAQGTIDESNYEPAGVSQTISPRLGFSFPVSERTVFYANYGKFVAQSRLRDVYQGNALVAFNIQGGYAISEPVGFGLRPERTTQYDVGFRQQIGENMSFDLSGFYRDIRGQIQMRQIPAAEGASHTAYYAFINGDFATTLGASLKMTLRRIERLQAQVDYTYSDARGTGSSPYNSFRTIWQAVGGIPFYPEYATLLDFDVTHKGAINLDYRYAKDDGPRIGDIYPLERTGLNVIFTFNSGHPYTRVDLQSIGQNAALPIEELNASRTPWNFQIDARLDKSFRVGPIDFNLYAWVINVLGTQNVTAVYSTTGSATDNGYLGTENGRKAVENYNAYGEIFGYLYQDMLREGYRNNGFYGTPRQIRFGLRFDF